MFQAINVKLIASNITGQQGFSVKADDQDYSLSNGSVGGTFCTVNGDTENEESTEDKSELDSSEMDDVSINL